MRRRSRRREHESFAQPVIIVPPAPALAIPSFNVAAKGDGRFNHSVFQVPGLISVPCDNEAHHVTVVELKELETKLLWYAVPKMDTRVHLNAKIKNTSEYVLLSGEASVYVDGTFISRSCVPSAGPDESFDCSLGLDSSIKITYHPLSSKVSQRTLFTGFTGLNSISTFGTTKTTATRYTQRVTVLNTKRVRIDALKLLDRLPVSEDERIAVKILKPAELNTSNNHNKPGQTQLTETAGGLDYQNVEDTSSVTSLKNGKKKRFSTSKILPSFGSSSAVPKSVEAMEGEPKKTFEYDGSASVPSTPASAPASTQNSGPDPKLQIVAQWDGTDADKEGPIHEDGHFDQAGGTGVSSAGRQGGEKERSAGLESDGKMNWLLHDIPPQGTVNLVLEWEVSAASNIRVYEREV
ncbi:hypothetical protein D9757_003569 [Collybiopsis confluens]|uniref:DUF4139 domain-containing protein n=1 Tax=Collybiopsis confluens TaxID=2823264 RepID=A0A8H5MDG8_9AGAR|nr:hypothetical protein D9757_003569 [Collybiopsis confluens]